MSVECNNYAETYAQNTLSEYKQQLKQKLSDLSNITPIDRNSQLSDIIDATVKMTSILSSVHDFLDS